MQEKIAIIFFVIVRIIVRNIHKKIIKKNLLPMGGKIVYNGYLKN